MQINMDEVVKLVRAERGEACIDKLGACHATPEATEWWNKLIDMRAAGKTPAEMKTALEAEMSALRADGHNI